MYIHVHIKVYVTSGNCEHFDHMIYFNILTYIIKHASFLHFIKYTLLLYPHYSIFCGSLTIATEIFEVKINKYLITFVANNANEPHL